MTRFGLACRPTAPEVIELMLVQATITTKVSPHAMSLGRMLLLLFELGYGLKMTRASVWRARSVPSGLALYSAGGATGASIASGRASPTNAMRAPSGRQAGWS